MAAHRLETLRRLKHLLFRPQLRPLRLAIEFSNAMHSLSIIVSETPTADYAGTRNQQNSRKIMMYKSRAFQSHHMRAPYKGQSHTILQYLRFHVI